MLFFYLIFLRSAKFQRLYQNLIHLDVQQYSQTIIIYFLTQYKQIYHDSLDLDSSVMSKQKKVQSKLDIEVSQLKVILNDFKKVKNKCLELCKKNNQEFPNLQTYETLERTTQLKMNLMDIQGVVNLKNQLIKSLTELYDIEHDLVYRSQRNQLKFNSPSGPKIRSRQEFPPQIEKLTLQVPIYHGRTQQNVQKVDRVSNYLYELRKNMRRLSTAMFKNYETKQFLLNQPEYIAARQKLQRFKMREQELSRIIQKKVKEQVEAFLQKCQKVQQTDEYTVIKVYQKNVGDLGKMCDRAHTQELLWNQIVQKNSISNINLKKRKPQLSHVKSQKQIRTLRLKPGKQASKSREKADLNQSSNSKNGFANNSRVQSKFSSRMNSQLGDDSQNKGNYVYMVHKFSPESQKNSSIISSLSSLRSKRKKIFNDDVWDQFDKI